MSTNDSELNYLIHKCLGKYAQDLSETNLSSDSFGYTFKVRIGRAFGVANAPTAEEAIRSAVAQAVKLLDADPSLAQPIITPDMPDNRFAARPRWLERPMRITLDSWNKEPR
jgi:hypothetical protein